jgi:hypothetical protein
VCGDAHALWQGDAEAIEQRGLGDIGLRDAAQPDLTERGGRQHDVVGLDTFELFNNGARGVTEAGTALPHLQGLPQHEGKEAHEDMSLNAVAALTPDGAHLELILLDTKGGLGLGQLDVGLPQLVIAPVVDVGAQQIGALRKRSPVVEGSVYFDLETEPHRAAILNQVHLEALSGTLVLLQDAADPSVDLLAIETLWSGRSEPPGVRAPSRCGR